jgi:Ser/Thr protein kinase RdoA (MazF antagonist)
VAVNAYFALKILRRGPCYLNRAVLQQGTRYANAHNRKNERPVVNSVDQLPHFHFLTPEVILNVAEAALATRCNGLCRPYKSYINRVYEIERDDGVSCVIKFYRPGRWTQEALQDEHDFLLDLAREEIPVIAPLVLQNGTTIGTYENTYFAIFPKKGGRNCDEFTHDEWLEIGHLLGRVHAVGALKTPRQRIQLVPGSATREHIAFIINGGFIPNDCIKQFSAVSDELISRIEPLFEDIPLIRLHGDCHFANIIHRPGESFYLIDFDDMAVGPAIQDVWMLLPGYVRDCRAELNLFIEGYEMFRSFEYAELRLIEPLRAMRYIHFIAWCAHQVADGGFTQLAPDWGTRAYWLSEIKDLSEQIEHIAKESD